MKVIRAEEMGFCIGVKRAFSMVENVRANYQGRKLYVYGDLAHNQSVMDRVASYGFDTVYHASDVEPRSVVLVRAHGISDSERKELEARGSEIIDATCPLVLKNQDLMRSSELDVILFGIKGHSETVAVEGAARRKYYVVQDVSDLAEVPNDRKYRVIVQTTFETRRYEMLLEELDRRGILYIVSNSICMASERRRASIRAMKGLVPYIYVIGDPRSANSNALVKEAFDNGIGSSLIESADDIRVEDIRGYETIGVSAGSSTPDDVIDKAVRRLEEI